SLVALMLLLPMTIPSDVATAMPMYADSPSPEHVYDQIDILDQWYRYLDSPGHRNAEAHILSMFDDYRLNTTVQAYTAQRLDGSVRAANVLGLLEGEDPTRCLVIGGHYDNNQRSSKGAYDNAVGVGTVIELARLFTQVHDDAPPFSVLFAAWDSEEGGGAGSNHFLENPVWDTEIIGYINLDMFGLSYPVRNSIPMSNEDYFKLNVYTSPVSDFSIYQNVEYTDEALANFSAFRDTLENITYDRYGHPSQWVIVMDDTAGISDHRFFVQRSIPSVWFRGMNEKPREEGDINEITFKHTPADTLETMERYAGGKTQLLEGIDTGLTIAYDLANDWMEHVNASLVSEVDVGPEDEGGEGIGVSGGAAVGLSLLVLLMIPIVFIVWRRRRG
ncbi:MAG: M28 family peptidase, partial [Thermoplasmata archaeon]